MKKATTYAEWVALLERFENEDDTVLDEIEISSFHLDAGTAQRFYLRIEEAYKKRKQSWLEKFQRSFQQQNINTHEAIGILLQNGKRALLPIVRFVLSKGLPKDIKTVLQKDIADFVTEVQQTMGNNIARTNQEREKMLIMLKTFQLADLTQQATSLSGPQTNNQNSSNRTPPSGRKIIF